jgi:hypothetical protein
VVGAFLHSVGLLRQTQKQPRERHVSSPAPHTEASQRVPSLYLSRQRYLHDPREAAEQKIALLRNPRHKLLQAVRQHKRPSAFKTRFHLV